MITIILDKVLGALKNPTVVIMLLIGLIIGLVFLNIRSCNKASDIKNANNLSGINAPITKQLDKKGDTVFIQKISTVADYRTAQQLATALTTNKQMQEELKNAKGLIQTQATTISSLQTSLSQTKDTKNQIDSLHEYCYHYGDSIKFSDSTKTLSWKATETFKREFIQMKLQTHYNATLVSTERKVKDGIEVHTIIDDPNASVVNGSTVLINTGNVSKHTFRNVLIGVGLGLVAGTYLTHTYWK